MRKLLVALAVVSLAASPAAAEKSRPTYGDPGFTFCSFFASIGNGRSFFIFCEMESHPRDNGYKG